ncbi:MAG: hypothetical protein QXT86_08990 [Archaeoglobaceae archaeon]
MSILRFYKVIANLPSTLQPNSIYAVRVGEGFDLYITDATGSVAHKVNTGGTFIPTPSPFSGFPPKPPGYNNYVVPYAIGGAAATTLALTSGRTYWIPIFVDRNVRITQVAINVTTASAGTHQVGIYSSNERGEPTNRLIMWDFNTGTTGLRTSTVGLPYTLQPNIYWIAWAAGSGATVRAVALTSARSLALPSLGTANLTCWFTSGNTLPATAPTSGYTALTSSALPAVGFHYVFP